jgi:TatD DNase family protein
VTAVLVDSHCHLDYEGLAERRSEVIARAHGAGVRLMVTISTRVKRFDRIVEIIEAHDSVYGSVGTHPHNAHEELDVTTDELVLLAGHPKIVAIGEAGLDYHYDTSPREAQETGFRRHIAAARITGLPLVIHARSADDDMIRILREEMAQGTFPAVLHCFSSSAALAQAGVELGLYVSFSGILTFKNSEDIRIVAAQVPADRLLVETDAPFLAPPPHRGRTNEPSYVVETAKVLSDVRGWPYDETARLTTENFLTLFSKVPREAVAAGATA